MMNDATETKSLATLEQLLEGVRDGAGRDPALAQAMSEAVKICQSRHVAHAGIHFQLQLALASIRTGRPSDDATRYIEIALDIQSLWSGTQA